jgi:RNA polymerase sigma-70 factor (ECF subfamily)
MSPTRDLSHASDQQLVTRALEDRQEAYAELYDRYHAAVNRLIYRRLCNTAEAEDLTQVTFVKAFRELGTYRPEMKFEPWLLTIARNTAVDHQRCQQIKALSLDGSPFAESPEQIGATALQVPGSIDSTPSNPTKVDKRKFFPALQRALRHLPLKHRRCFELHHIEELSYGHVAELLDMPTPTVRTYTSRARQQLRDVLGPQLPSLLKSPTPP